MSKGSKRKDNLVSGSTSRPIARTHTLQANSNNKSIWARHRDIIICQVLALFCVAIYGQVRRFEFISLDDGSYVYENPNVIGGLSGHALRWAFTTFHSTNWHPLTWISHLLDVQLFGLDPGMHHLTNLLFHILNSVLLYALFKRLTGATWRSAFVAALFAVHPLHVESVAWVAERKDVLSTFFWLLTILAYARYAELPSSWKRYLLVLLGFILGLLAKPMLVTLPFVLLLMDYWPLERIEVVKGDGLKKLALKTWPLVREKLPFGLLVVASSIVTFMAQRSGGAVQSLERFPLSLRVTNAFVSYITYVAKMFWPANLGIWYPYDKTLSSWYGIVSAAILAAVSILIIRVATRRKYLVTGWLWYLGTMVPVIGFVQVGSQALADRYMYVPMIGLLFAIAWGSVELAEHYGISRSIVHAFAVVIVIVLSVISWKQVSYWQNNELLYTRTINVTRNNWLAQHNLCVDLANLNRPDEAVPHCQETLRIMPTHLEAVNSLGFALLKQSRYLEAAQYFVQYIKTRQDEPRVYLNLVVALSSLGRTGEAVRAYDEAERLDPLHTKSLANFVLALSALTEAFANDQSLSEADKYAQKALQLDPQSPDAHASHALVLLKQGRTNESFSAANDAIRLNPKNSTAHNNLGLVLMAQGKQREAALEFATAVKLNPHNPLAQMNLRKAQPPAEGFRD